MAFKHGVFKSEVPTSIIAPSQGESGLPVVIGTAPVFMADASCVNVPRLVYTYEEAVSIFGYSSDWEKWTLCEFMYSQFALYGQAPCVLINVFDPAKHSKTERGADYFVSGEYVNLGPDVIKADMYTLHYDENGDALVKVEAGEEALVVAQITKADVSKVTKSDIIGGVNATTGAHTGLELVHDVFPKFRLVPGLIGAPGWSSDSEVAAVMRAKSENINGLFTCSSVVDIPCGNGGAKIYSQVSEVKNRLNFTGERQIVCWPLVTLGGKKYHLSTHMIGVMNRTDGTHNDVPYKSPSNELLQIDGCCDGAGKEILLHHEQATYLNSQGVVTALNWIGGWRAWGNRTGAYPSSTDVKDVFIPVRRMIDFLGNTFITTFWAKTDEPMNPRLIRTIVNSFNMYINSLVSREMLLGGRVEFREDENSYTDLLNGIIRFHIFITPPVPAEVIEGIFEYDPEYLKTLYEALR